jgi:prevent-host-death family protein
METTRVTASEFQQAFDALSDKARREPVVITENGRDSLVVISADEWERLRRGDRRVGLTAELDAQWIEAVSAAAVSDDYAHFDTELG